MIIKIQKIICDRCLTEKTIKLGSLAGSGYMRCIMGEEEYDLCSNCRREYHTQLKEFQRNFMKVGEIEG